MTTTREFIDFLLDTCLEMDIPLSKPASELTDDIQHYVYSCTVHRKCAVCGKHADIHHCKGSVIGIGRNRKEVIHVGLELMPLCREHHTECHSIGQDIFNEKYHLEGVIADENLCKKVGLKYAE